MAAKNILMLVGDFSEDYEVMCSYVTLRVAGHTVHVVAPNKKSGDTILTSIHDFDLPQADTYSEKPGHRFTLNATFDDVKAEDYDALLCPGGRGTEYISLNPEVMAIVRHFAQVGKPMASICNGIEVYAAAQVLAGKSCVGYPSNRPEVVAVGGKWTDIEVVRGAAEDRAIVDGHLVTAPCWGALSGMLTRFLEVLGTRIEP